MEKSMEILLSRLDEKLQQQTKIITTTVTESVMVAIDERLKTIMDENTKLKEKISTLEQKLRGMEFEKRKYNLVFFGIEESETSTKSPPSRLVPVGVIDHNPPEVKPNTNTQNKNKSNDINIATINCRSFRTPEKLQELEIALEELKWEIIGISEIRRLGQSIEDHGKYILHYIGDTPGMYGVGFMIKKNFSKNIMELRGITERIAMLNIKLNEEEWSIIQVYSPTESDKEEAEIFYEQLQNTIETAHKNVIVMGDLNGQIGTQKIGEEQAIGQHGFGTRSKNGTKLVNFCLQNRLSILNSFYKKKITNKWTWISPNGLYRNEIDFIMSNNRKHFKDLSVIKNLNFNTDHRMVRATMAGILPKKPRRFHDKYAVAQYTGETEVLLNNLKTALDSKTSLQLEGKYNNLLHQLKTVTKKTSTHMKKEISPKIKELIKNRKELLQGNTTQDSRRRISEISKQISSQLRRERKTKRSNTLKNYIEKTGGVKKALKELNYKKDWIPNMRNREGKNTGNRLEILKLATNFYRTLYQSLEIEHVVKHYDTPTNEQEIPEIIKEEVIRAVRTQKNDKAPGSDLVTNELLKITLPVIASKLTQIFNEIIETEKTPKDWTKSTIILLHKKGDKGDITNYRPISLMSNMYKVFSKIILSRIETTLEESQPKEQAGFRRNYSTIDHIHVLRQILQKYKEYNKTYYLAFVDYNKAFDTIEHGFIWEALRTQGVPTKYIRILQNVYTKSTARVKLEALGEEFPIRRGVRQGDPISPKLFSAVLEMVFRNLDWTNKGLNINGEYLTHLRFADDLIIFSECPKALEIMLQQLADESGKAGLTMNLAKTKIMSNSSQTVTIKVDEEEIAYVHEYVYLGQLVSTTDCMKKEIERRVSNTWKRYWSLSEVMKNQEMPIKAKRKVYNMCILPCLLYGCQTWALTEHLANKIKVCQNGMERSVIGVKIRDREKLTDIKSLTKFKDAYITYKELKWRWAGHMAREKQEKWTRLVTEWCPLDGRRSRGRPTKRWEDDLKGVAGPTWSRTAKNRTEWKTLEEAFVVRQVE
ncbi:hypothetical protein B5X24_HaOG202399 [Helicoverpa armigera]|nr:hypothetical protein B5X24_HaOG202399 [Helicoverpa armigera]